MKKYLLMLLTATALAGCTQIADLLYDDSEIVGRLDDLEDRIEKLEEACAKMNSEIESMQAIVDALAENDYVADVTPILEKGEEIGYSIELGSGKEITVYHGTDGAPGESAKAPVIGVQKDKDGEYYWTLDGEWLLDSTGRKVRATGKDYAGSSSNVPQLKIEDGYWCVSYDKGKTWEQLDKAIEEGGQSLFESVTYDENYMYFKLLDGTELTLPIASSLDVAFDMAMPVDMKPNSTIEVGYTVKSAAQDIIVEVSSSIDLKAKVIPDGKLTGKVQIKSGGIIDGYSKALVIVSDGNRTITRPITFVAAEEEIFEIIPKSVDVPAGGGEFKITILTNMGYKISSMAEWISEVGSVSNPETRETVHTFYAEPNKGEEVRNGSVVFCNDSQLCVPASVVQAGRGNWAGNRLLHRSVAMRFTADWCGFCPQMATSFEMAKEDMSGNLEVISMHCDGGLAFSKSGPLSAQFAIAGFPTGIVDGRTMVENYDSQTVARLTKIASEETETVYSTVTGVSIVSKLDGSELTADVTAYLKKAETYKITAMLVEDNIIGYQANYDTGETDDYVHNGVPRLALTNILGDSFTMTEENGTKDFSYKVTIPAKCNIDNVRIVIYIQRNFGSQNRIQSGSYGDFYIDNSATVKAGENLDLQFAD